ncbi:MAG: hypothetical protein ACJ74Z_17600 [Bryobacteraceae bacterium]
MRQFPDRQKQRWDIHRSREDKSVEAPTFSVAYPAGGDVERALRFYVDAVGFTLDVDYAPNDSFRVPCN